jgi:hypothetical protein
MIVQTTSRESSFGPKPAIVNYRHVVAPSTVLNMQLKSKSKKSLKASESKETLKPVKNADLESASKLNNGPKMVKYSDPSVKIGTGKYGPVDLIIY